MLNASGFPLDEKRALGLKGEACKVVVQQHSIRLSPAFPPKGRNKSPVCPSARLNNSVSWLPDTPSLGTMNQAALARTA